MKKFRFAFIALVAVVSVLLYTACDKAEDKDTTSSNSLVGTWITPGCDGTMTDATTWYLGSDGRGYSSTKDCNGICSPLVYNFSYSISGNTIYYQYDDVQPVMHCVGYSDSRPQSPGNVSQSFYLEGNSVTVSYNGITTVFTRKGTTPGGTPGGTTGDESGNAMFWVSSDLGVGYITVSCNGMSQTISSYYDSAPSCGAASCANFGLKPGVYQYTASAETMTWSGSVTVTSGGCSRIQLTL